MNLQNGMNALREAVTRLVDGLRMMDSEVARKKLLLWAFAWSVVALVLAAAYGVSISGSIDALWNIYVALGHGG